MAAGHLVWDRLLFLLLCVTKCVVGAHSHELDPMLFFSENVNFFDENVNLFDENVILL